MTDVVATSARFCRALREEGVPVTVAEAVTAVRALEHLDLGDRREIYLGLRALLTGSVRDYPAFDEAFRAFWDRLGLEGEPPEERRIPAPFPDPRPGGEPTTRRSPVSLEAWLARGRGGDEHEEAGALPAPSPRESLRTTDFGELAGQDVERVLRATRRLARKVARRPGRRWRADPRGSRVHLRRTLRRSLATGGQACRLEYRARKPRPVKLVALCDVSGSMQLYSRFLLQFLYGLQHAFHQVETFVFGTRLSRVTDALAAGDYREALDRLGREVQDFSGGTRIGESLARFVEEWPHLLDGRTVVLVLSDGWERGPPEVLSRAVEEMSRQARRVVWLNPLMGSEAFRPATRGMEAVLPHLDALAPVHSLASLEALSDHLRA